MLAVAMAVALLSVTPAADAAPASAPPGTVTVVLAAGEARPMPSDRPFADAVGQALGEANFTLMPQPGHSRYVAEVSVGREARGLVTARAPTDRAQAGIGSWGPSIRVPLSSKKMQLRNLVSTTLTVRILTLADHHPVWTGSAVTVQPEEPQGDASPTVALKLARAVVAAYPHPLATPVSVP